MTKTLHPCPFCGGKAKYASYRTSEDSEACQVSCTSCDARTNEFEDAYAPLEDALDAWNCRSSRPAPGSLPIELDGVTRQIAEEGGAWRSCSGCHELNEGMPTGSYSSVIKCHLGLGCHECGGIGAIWDTTDYAAMADFIASDTPSPTQLSVGGSKPTPEQIAGTDPSVRVVFGLKAQGHIPTVEAMLAEGQDWSAIGSRIGWDGETARQYYDRHLKRDVDDTAVDRFSSAMKAKLAKKRAEGRGGWDNPDECSIAFLSELLREHVAKGDPVDVGNLAMMIHQRGGIIE